MATVRYTGISILNDRTIKKRDHEVVDKTKKRIKLLSKYDSDCYFSYLTGCDDIKQGQPIYHAGYGMNWHRKCEPKDFMG